MILKSQYSQKNKKQQKQTRFQKSHICTYDNINNNGSVNIQDKAEACLALIPHVRDPKHVSTHNET